MGRFKKSKANPFDKYLRPEDHLHFQVVEYLRYQYPQATFHHSPMEGRRSPFERYLLKKLGAKRGFIDIIIFDNGGLAMELKIKPNKPSEGQVWWLERLGKLGFKKAVCYTFEEAKVCIDNHFH